jgi:bacteriorhodopsin
MAMWILVAVFGVLVSLVGFWVLVRKYRRGEIRGRYLVAVIVGVISLAAWALLTNLQPNAVDSLVE